MGKPAEQCTVVFALIAAEPEMNGCVCGGGGCYFSPPPLTSCRIRNNLCKDDSALFSRFLRG